MFSSWSSPTISTDNWKILDDYKFFTKRRNLDDSIDVCLKELNEAIGESVQINKTFTSDEEYIYDINEYASNAEESENVTKESRTSAPRTDFNPQKMIVLRTSKANMSPVLTVKQSRAIQTFASIHLDANVLTWTSFHIDRSKELPTITVLNWNNIEIAIERMKLWQILSEVDELLQNIPVCDVYVIENLAAGKFRNNVRQVNEMMLMSQYFSVTASLLAARNPDKSYANAPNVLFMARDLIGKFYNLYIGKETVSTQNMVRDMINKKQVATEDGMMNNDILFEEEIVGSFKTASRVRREYLSRTMLIGLTFYRLNMMGDKSKKSSLSGD